MTSARRSISCVAQSGQRQSEGAAAVISAVLLSGMIGLGAGFAFGVLGTLWWAFRRMDEHG